jgi:hypothetical protein
VKIGATTRKHHVNGGPMAAGAEEAYLLSSGESSGDKNSALLRSHRRRIVAVISATTSVLLLISALTVIVRERWWLAPQQLVAPQATSVPRAWGSSIIEGSTLRWYKRSFASTNASADAVFMANNLGLSIDLDEVYRCDHGVGDWTFGSLCAHRAIVSSLSQWELHFFTSNVTPMDEITVDDWVSYWDELHGDLSSPDYSWDAFVVQGVTFYAPELSAFLYKWQRDGVPYLLRQTSSSVDGSLMWSGRVNIPNSGHTIEVVASSVADDLRASFVAYSPDECGQANRVPHPTSAQPNMACNGWKHARR